MNSSDLGKLVKELKLLVQHLAELQKVKAHLGRLPNSGMKTSLRAYIAELEGSTYDPTLDWKSPPQEGDVKFLTASDNQQGGDSPF